MAPLPTTSPRPLSSPLFPSASRGLDPLLRTSEAIRGGAHLRSSNPIRLRRRVASAGSAPPTRPRTCKNCKRQFDAALNHPAACRLHTAHFGGETKRKFESVYTGGTMDTPDSGKVFQYWHCCGSEDPSDPGCTAAPHASYDDV